MTRNSKRLLVTRQGSRAFSAYVEAVQTGHLLFLSGMLPTDIGLTVLA
jgi:hypothetical protein